MKRALVTGASNGLGAALAVRLAAAGHHVVSIDRQDAEPGAPVTTIACDLADRDEVDRALPLLLSAGPYDVVVLNAGVSATGRFEDIPANAYSRLLTVNAETPIVLASSLVRANAVRGSLCFVSSLSHFTGYPGAAVYAASKDAVAVYARSVRRAFAVSGVTVTLACPGPLRTSHAERHAPLDADEGSRMAPDVAARAIIDGMAAGRFLVVPGRNARLAALAGRLFPAATTAAMRRLIFDRLDEAVW